MKLIGLTGKARSGKDSVAKMLTLQHGYIRTSFADPLKAAAQHIFGLSYRQTWCDDVKEVEIPRWGMTPRRIFQLLGTEAIKPAFGVDVWFKRWKMGFDAIKDTDNVVVTDVRFDLERDELYKLGAIIVEIRRGEGLNGSAGEHSSEQGLSAPPDFIIENDGTLEDLQVKVEALVKGIQ